ncbi:MAG: protein-L-isoaspartate O-methyltransferase [Rickettsiales bacterium]
MLRHKLQISELQGNHMALAQLATNKVNDKNILQILVDVKRENFVPRNLRGVAYIDDDIPIDSGRVLLAPLTFARLLELAEVTASCRVLIIGGGNGYAAAVLTELAGHVVSIDSDSELIAQSIAHAANLELKDVDIQQVKNMADGYPLSAPYDVIFINGAIEYLPEDLSSQLSIGGRLVAIRNIAKTLGKGILVKRIDGQTNIREYFDASTIVLNGFKKTKQFVF